jgi:hypothetical protein
MPVPSMYLKRHTMRHNINILLKVPILECGFAKLSTVPVTFLFPNWDELYIIILISINYFKIISTILGELYVQIPLLLGINGSIIVISTANSNAYSK